MNTTDTLKGVATAIYGNAELSTVSIARLSAERSDEIYVDSGDKIKFETNDIERARKALLVVLREIVSHRAQVMEIHGQMVQVPLTVTHGTADGSPADLYNVMLYKAFPEIFASKKALPKGYPVQKAMDYLILNYFKKNGVAGGAGEFDPLIETNTFRFGEPECARVVRNITGISQSAEELVRSLLTKAKAGDGESNAALLALAKQDAEKYVGEFLANGSYEGTRFLQVGHHTPDFQNSPRFTYMEHLGLRSVFAHFFVKYFLVPKNICVKTPNSRVGFPFEDINASFMQDILHRIEAMLEKRPQKYPGHVEAKMRT